jgi:transcriptional regulator NrdR family protein
LRALKKADPVAYVRFASVYKQFDNLDDFQRFIK